jgi:hypothetical protein
MRKHPVGLAASALALALAVTPPGTQAADLVLVSCSNAAMVSLIASSSWS